MMELRFEIGQWAWFAHAEHVSHDIPCPDCDGSRRIKVILATGEEHDLACDLCSRGYLGPTGTLQVTKFDASPKRVQIKGISMTEEGVEWRTSFSWACPDADMFATPEGALVRAKEKVSSFLAAEDEKLGRKVKATRNWAWHVRHHRGEIREAEKRIEWHSRKLGIARTKVKGEKN